MTDQQKIITFIEKYHVVTICSCRGEVPWAANCFYAFDAEAMRFLVMSDDKTRHVGEWRDRDIVAGTVSNQEARVSHLQGVQFTARAVPLTNEEGRAAKALYIRRFPIAAVHSAPLWAIEIGMAKFTDNRLGFGRKMIWQRAPAQ